MRAVKKAIVILGGGLIKERGKWRTTNFDEGDNFGASGDRLRVVAGSCWYGKHPDALVIVSAGKGQYQNIPGAPTIAEVMKKELVALGVPLCLIKKEEESGNTWQQLQSVKKIISKSKFNKVLILSNQWHLPRVQAMIKIDTTLKSMLTAGKIELVSAEKIVLKYAPAEWKKIIQLAYRSSVLKKRIALEKEGVRQIKAGTYNLK